MISNDNRRLYDSDKCKDWGLDYQNNEQTFNFQSKYITPINYIFQMLLSS